MKSPMKSKALIAVLAASCLFQAAFASGGDFVIYLENASDRDPIRISLKAGEEGSWTDIVLSRRVIRGWRIPPDQSELKFKMITNEGDRLYRLVREENEPYAFYQVRIDRNGSGHLDLYQVGRSRLAKFLRQIF